MIRWVYFTAIMLFAFQAVAQQQSWIHINWLGYQPDGVKVAVWCSKEQSASCNLHAGKAGWESVDAKTDEIVFSGKPGKAFGVYGPFKQTCRLNFSAFKKPGRYYLRAGGIKSPEFNIGEDVYKGMADFCLRYMRQQRSGFNPFLKDSCHTHDGYVLYGEKAGIKDNTHVDVTGGWHDASDYLQYSATSANATYHLLAAYRDFPNVFSDEKQANGLDGRNGIADVLDEAKWGLDWLLKMHPRDDWMFNQLGDDRDHMGMRIPKQDTNFYGKGLERPVYFISGEPQQRGKFMNNTTGTSSTAAKFASAFALGFMLFGDIQHYFDVFSKGVKKTFGDSLFEAALSAYKFGQKKPGVSQTASVKSPYIYVEDNWADDMELAAAQMYAVSKGITHMGNYMMDAYMNYSQQEKITPWLGADTAHHYQWYPFINIGHYELAKQLKKINLKEADTIISYYKAGIQKVWNKAKQNAFYRGIPFIWCSNNLTTSFAIQCYWYKQLSGDKSFDELAQANLDWLFGCNPWGTSMVYGLPSWGDTPADPHSAFTHLKNYPIDGGLVDGPVDASIYKNLIGITLYQPDEYEVFQSDLAVYHDDYGDYSTNEPTMDGTASLIYLLAAKETPDSQPRQPGSGNKAINQNLLYDHGAIIRGNASEKQITLVFTGDEFADGGEYIANTLKEKSVKASFFFTDRFYKNIQNRFVIEQLKKDGHYLGAHSYDHLLYCDWNKRDSLLVTKNQFKTDLLKNFIIMAAHTLNPETSPYFLPPYEWYNDSISAWTKEMGLQLVSYTPGTLSHADYTTPDMKNYRSSETIYNSVIEHEQTNPSGLNGFILLLHIGAAPQRTDKFYYHLPELIQSLRQKGYRFSCIDKMLK